AADIEDTADVALHHIATHRHTIAVEHRRTFSIARFTKCRELAEGRADRRSQHLDVVEIANLIAGRYRTTHVHAQRWSAVVVVQVVQTDFRLVGDSVATADTPLTRAAGPDVGTASQAATGRTVVDAKTGGAGTQGIAGAGVHAGSRQQRFME